ncbi:MAG: YegS/Rv2252/BmrU family lipid kinase [Puia sp.]|nr:YegS/Rv2252/BmrU family lipid kinase [Puia sp.]
MARNIIYLINPISGTHGKSSLREMISQKTSERRIGYSILPTNKEGDYAFLRGLIKQDGVTDVVVCGGDGTVNAVAAALMGVPVNIGIIPMGSGNGLALTAGISRKAAKALEVIFAGKASFIDGFYINDQFSCMLCGIGFDALVAHEFAIQKRRGLQTYIRVSLVNFFKARPYTFRIHMPDLSIDAKAYFISIANSNQFGNNFTIAPRARLNDGLLDIVIVKKMSKFRLPFSVLSQISGSRSRDILYYQVPGLTIENPEQAPLHIDGDPKETAPEFRIRVLPQALKLLQP